MIINQNKGILIWQGREEAVIKEGARVAVIHQEVVAQDLIRIHTTKDRIIVIISIIVVELRISIKRTVEGIQVAKEYYLHRVVKSLYHHNIMVSELILMWV